MRTLVCLSLSLSLVLCQFDKSECEVSKCCFFDTTCSKDHLDDCVIGLSYRYISDEFLAIELFGTLKVGGKDFTNAGYLAVGWSTNTEMGDTRVTECSKLASEMTPSMKLSYNTPGGESYTERIPGETSFRDEILFNSTARFIDGQLYCSAVQKVKDARTVSESSLVFEWNPSRDYYVFLATGPADAKDINRHAKKPTVTASAVDLKEVATPGSDNSTMRLMRAHAILMCFAWLFFIPSAFLFARFMRGAWPDYKPMGLLIWFHVHRACNIVGIALMISSLVCIAVAKKWTWLGWGSGSAHWVLTHTMCGVFSCAFAFLQPFISTLRCDAGNPRRPIFNWIHRMIGSIAFVLATTTVVIAAAHFELWDQPALQICLTLTPLILSLLLTAIFVVIDWKVVVDQFNRQKVHRIRGAIVFSGIGILLIVNIWVSVLICKN